MILFNSTIEKKVTFTTYGHIDRIDGIEYPTYKDVFEKIVYPECKVLLFVEVGSYSGDFHLLAEENVEDYPEYLYYKGSYGSCSGCDDLEAVRNVEDLSNLCSQMFRMTHRFQRTDMILFLNSYIKEGLRDSYYEKEAKEAFLDKSLELLTK